MFCKPCPVGEMDIRVVGVVLLQVPVVGRELREQVKLQLKRGHRVLKVIGVNMVLEIPDLGAEIPDIGLMGTSSSLDRSLAARISRAFASLHQCTCDQCQKLGPSTVSLWFHCSPA